MASDESYELTGGIVAAANPSYDGHKIYPHGKPEPLVPGLWRVEGSLPPPLPLKRNMFIYQLPDGELLLDSVIAMDDEGMDALEELGRPEIMVVPHPHHTMDAEFYKLRYPHLKIVGAEDAHHKLPDLRFDGTPETVLPEYGIETHIVPGLKVIEEVLDLPLRDGRALLFADLVHQNAPDAGLLMRILGAPDGAGVARILKLTQIRDKERVRSFLWRMAARPNLRLVAGCHGSVVTERCAEWLAHAAVTL